LYLDCVQDATVLEVRWN